MLKRVLIASLALVSAFSVSAVAVSPADLSDLEIAHVAYTADVIDIRYAHLALAISKNPAIHEFARTMIRGQLNEQADQLIAEMSQLSGAAFDRRYAENELGYHQAVNALVGGTFIPNIEHPQVKALFEEALIIFKAHEKHAEMMVNALTS